jgi:hypothetical protein
MSNGRVGGIVLHASELTLPGTFRRACDVGFLSDVWYGMVLQAKKRD